jgi:hypothetical protein
MTDSDRDVTRRTRLAAERNRQLRRMQVERALGTLGIIVAQP